MSIGSFQKDNYRGGDIQALIFEVTGRQFCFEISAWLIKYFGNFVFGFSSLRLRDFSVRCFLFVRQDEEDEMKNKRKILVTCDLSFASTETKYIKLKTKTQSNIVIFGIFHKI